MGGAYLNEINTDKAETKDRDGERPSPDDSTGALGDLIHFPLDLATYTSK